MATAGVSHQPDRQGWEGPTRRGTRFGSMRPDRLSRAHVPLGAARDLIVLDELLASSTSADGSSSDVTPLGRGTSSRSESHDRFAVLPSTDSTPGTFRLRRYSLRPGELSSFFPVIESFGLAVSEIFHYHIEPGAEGERGAHIEDFVLRLMTPVGGDGVFDPDADGPRLVDALDAIGRAKCDVDSLNQLVIFSSLDWRQVVVLRAYGRYLQQLGGASRDGGLEGALVSCPGLAQGLVEYFEARFDPHRSNRDDSATAARRGVIDGLSAVT